jgi:hypothetical protein
MSGTPVAVKFNTSGATTSTSAGRTTASGSTFLIGIIEAAGQSGTQTPTDNKSNTYTQLGTTQSDGSAQLRVYKCENGTGGAGHTATVTWGSNSDATCFFIECPGVATASIDTGATAQSGATGASPYQVTSGTPDSATDQFLTFCGGAWTNYDASPSGFTNLSTETNNSLYWTGGVAYLNVTAPSSAVTAGWTITSASSAARIIIGFKPATGGASVTATQTTAATTQTATLTGRAAVSAAQTTVAASQTATLLGTQQWNPNDVSADLTLSSSNTVATRNATSNNAYRGVRAALPIGSKRYWEVEVTASDAIATPGDFQIIGIAGKAQNLNLGVGGDSTNEGWGYAIREGALYHLGSQPIVPGGLPTAVQGDIIMFAVDTAANKLWIGKNGTWFQSGNPAAGTGAQTSSLTGTLYPATSLYRSTYANTARFDSTVKYQPPAGFTTFNGITAGAAQTTVQTSQVATLTHSVPGDADFGKVTLLLHMDGANGGSTFTDSSLYARTMAPLGSPTTSTTQVKYGTAAYSGAAGKYLTATAATEFDCGTADFTCEGWGYTATPGALMVLMCTRTGGGSDRGPIVFTNGSGALRGFCGDSSGAVFGDISGGTVPTSTWFHWAYVRSGTNFYLFLDGVQVGSTVTSSTACGGGQTLYIGRDPGTSGREWVGFLDEIRRTNGVARYTSNFTPVGPFPDSNSTAAAVSASQTTVQTTNAATLAARASVSASQTTVQATQTATIAVASTASVAAAQTTLQAAQAATIVATASLSAAQTTEQAINAATLGTMAVGVQAAQTTLQAAQAATVIALAQLQAAQTTQQAAQVATLAARIGVSADQLTLPTSQLALIKRAYEFVRDERTWVIQAEDRASLVVAEDRSSSWILPEDRSNPGLPEDRSLSLIGD